jgi:gliding motility-associated-like protein
VRDTYNCNELIYEITVIDYPKFFTPNNDGYNDTWNLYGMQDQLDAKIYIFDRYGKLIKQISPNGTGWDGTLNGEPLGTNDYWFTVEYTEPTDSVKKIFKSHFTLKR